MLPDSAGRLNSQGAPQNLLQYLGRFTLTDEAKFNTALYIKAEWIKSSAVGVTRRVPLPFSYLFDGALPDAGLPRAAEAARHRGPFAIPFGQVSPGSACPQYPEDPISDLAMVKIRSTRFWFLRWQQRL